MVYLKILTENAPYCKTHLNETQSVEESLKEQPKEKAARDSTQKTDSTISYFILPKY